MADNTPRFVVQIEEWGDDDVQDFIDSWNEGNSIGSADHFEYFDGREWAGESFHEGEADAVDIEVEEHDVVVHGRGRQQDRTTVSVTPPERLLYPRRVETVAEARALYCRDEITLDDFERYVECVLGDTEPVGELA